MPVLSTVLKRTFSTATTPKNVIKNVTVIGGGLMGSGIAQVSAQTGHDVVLVDVSRDLLKKSEAAIIESVARVAKRRHKDDDRAAKKLTESTLSRVKYATDALESVRSCDLVVEAVVENLQLKRKLFETLDAAAPRNAIFASNTSSLSIAEIASATNRKDRFGGLHFFSPVPVMRLLEVVRIPETTEDTYQTMMAWGEAIGKTCITCKDTPGFVVNRLLVPYISEAVRMLERGDASAEDIDTAMKLGAGLPMGPLELADFTGLDVGVFVLEGWHEKYPENPLFAPVELQKRLVKEGKLGRKSGEGFYKYNK